MANVWNDRPTKMVWNIKRIGVKEPYKKVYAFSFRDACESLGFICNECEGFIKP